MNKLKKLIPNHLKLESHTYTTADGYINTIHRINSYVLSKKQQPTPVLFQHGLLDSSAGFCSNGDRSIAF